MKTLTLLLCLTLVGVHSSIDDSTEELSRTLKNYNPKMSDIETHPVALLMSKLKNELAQGDQTLAPIRILDDLVAELAGPVSELTDEHFRTLQEYHLLRDTFQQFCHAVVDLFASTREFYHAREKHSGMELNNIFRHLSFMNNRLTEMSHLVDTLLDKQGASQAIKAIRKVIDIKWTELREFDKQELNKIKNKQTSNLISSLFMPDGERDGVSVINQQMRNLDDYFVQMSLAYVEFKVHVSVLRRHIQDTLAGFGSFRKEDDLIVSDVRTLEAFVRKETASMYNKINSIWKLDGGKSLVKLPRFKD